MGIIYSRAILYKDDSGIETGVSFDPTYRLCSENQSYVNIHGVGDDGYGSSVRVDHIPHLIEWLHEVAALDREFRAQEPS